MNFLSSISNLVNEATNTIQGLNIRKRKSDFVENEPWMRYFYSIIRLRVKSLVVNESWMGFHLLCLHTYTTSTIDFKVLFIDVWLQSLTFSCISQTIERHLSADDDEESFLRRGSRGESTLSPGPGLKPVSPGARYVSVCYSFAPDLLNHKEVHFNDDDDAESD